MRTAKISRKTKETDISAILSLDGGECEISTGIGFFDHMLTAFAVHGGFGLKLKVKGDLEVDGHHTVEDTGIVLGQAFSKALGDKSGIARYGSFYVPMDEALALCVVDVSGRPYLVFDDVFDGQMIGGLDSSLIVEFLRAFAFNAGITLHINVMYGKNAHHMAEAVFKSLGHALKAACAITGSDVLSTKGVL
ncbi:Imidazoleglycerol-phosphate dehydratase [[Clostridium] cellulosi]|jgi:imidazoleglycerol-phosphate dehydratase (EC 4.2.1.19)|uniref:Imidazoleglycerol-phosphate dehydratase n=1 Tax=[Clostridium] cellulosi TaxID=29343 RepID=A0A078KNN7_9FIRM|nr:Imidazoleglycerol-phosphate dehydratase [[Clostridium] cellulosi]